MTSGLAGFLNSEWPKAKVVGCSPTNSRVMVDSIKAGKILDLPSLPTLSDGTAGGVEQDAITYDFVEQLVPLFETVTEAEIMDAMRTFMEIHHQMIEGAAGVAVASMLKQRDKLAGKRVVVIICGGNIALETLKPIL